MATRSDDELTLFFYGEHASSAEIEREMANDAVLAARYETLRRDLGALDVVDAPEPRPGLEQRMWVRVASSIERPSKRAAASPRWAMLTATVVAVALLGFLAGRGLRRTSTESSVAATLRALPPEARDRVLQAALADHLDSSQRLLLEVANGAPSLDEERTWAETLLSANRLYRRAAERAGQRRIAAVLAELDPVLTQLAEAPESFDLRRSQQQIERADLLFKVRIARNNLKELS